MTALAARSFFPISVHDRAEDPLFSLIRESALAFAAAWICRLVDFVLKYFICAVAIHGKFLETNECVVHAHKQVFVFKNCLNQATHP